MYKIWKIIRIILLVILLGIILYCVFELGKYLIDNMKNKEINEQLQREYHNFSSEDNYKGKYDSLLKINEDVVGWIKIADTKIDYPVVQTDNNKFYLKHNIYKEYSNRGCIFIDSRNNINGDERNIIIYGHNMKDGSIFEEITDYKDLNFYYKHPIIEFNTLEEDISWQIFSCYIVTGDVKYNKTYFNNEDEYIKFLDEIKQQSIYNTRIAISKDDRILTLSTCTYEFNDARFIVHAKMIN